MIDQIHIVTVYASDQQQALEFWRDKLGFEVREDQEFMPQARWITVAPPGAQTCFALWPISAPHMEGASLGGFRGVSLTSNDLQRDYERLSAQGVRFTQEPKQMPWGISAMFVDPDGNEFNVVQPT